MAERSIPMEYMDAMNRLLSVQRPQCARRGETIAGFARRDFMFLRTIELFHLAQPDVTGIYVNDLARRMHVTKSAASRTLQRLEQRGLIERTVDPHDRRNIFVSLTEAGRAFGRQQREQFECFFSRVVRRLGEQRALEILAGMRELAQAIQAETEGMPAEFDAAGVSRIKERSNPCDLF